MDDAYEMASDWINNLAYSDLRSLFEREPTEEELEDYREALIDRFYP